MARPFCEKQNRAANVSTKEPGRSDRHVADPPESAMLQIKDKNNAVEGSQTARIEQTVRLDDATIFSAVFGWFALLWHVGELLYRSNLRDRISENNSVSERAKSRLVPRHFIRGAHVEGQADGRGLPRGIWMHPNKYLRITDDPRVAGTSISPRIAVMETIEPSELSRALSANGHLESAGPAFADSRQLAIWGNTRRTSSSPSGIAHAVAEQSGIRCCPERQKMAEPRTAIAATAAA